MSVICPACDRGFEELWNDQGSLFCPTCGHVFAHHEAKQGAPSVIYEPGSNLGGFEIERLISSSGMNHVYQARQLSLNRVVALKLMRMRDFDDADAIHRFMQEMRHTALLEHPHIVTLYEAGHVEGVCYYAMAFVEGETLEDTLRHLGGPLPEAQALGQMRQVADALRYAWNKFGILHRDLKPANMMLDKAGDVKLLDLGISKREGDKQDIVQQGVAIGTPHYMSPEQSRGSVNLDFRSDLYSLGITLYHLVTDTVPYHSDSVPAILLMHNRDPVPDPRLRNPQLSEGCAVLLERMLGKRRADRPISWEALIEDIDTVLAGGVPGRHLGEPVDPQALSDTAIPLTLPQLHTPRDPSSTVVLGPDVSNELWQRRRPKPWQRPGVLIAVAVVLLLATLALGAAIAFAPPSRRAPGPNDDAVPPTSHAGLRDGAERAGDANVNGDINANPNANAAAPGE